VVAVPVDARRWHKPGQAVEQFEECETKLVATVQIGFGESVHRASVRRGERLETDGGVESLQGERPPGAVANESLETRPVLALDADGAVDRVSAAPAPCAHVRRRGGVQESAPREPPQDAKLDRAGRGFRISGCECGRLEEADSVLDVAGDHAIEGQHMVVVETRSEASSAGYHRSASPRAPFRRGRVANADTPVHPAASSSLAPDPDESSGVRGRWGAFGGRRRPCACPAQAHLPISIP
jgi:hypothetical protein